MSLWVEPPELIDTVANETLLRFANERWSLDQATWRSPTVVALLLRRYPGDHSPSQLEVVIDCPARTATLGALTDVPLSGLEGALDQALHSGVDNARR